MIRLRSAIFGTIAALAAGTAHAASINVTEANFTVGASTAVVNAPGLTLEWKAQGGTNTFQKKDSPMPVGSAFGPVLKGVGVGGSTAGEIDRGEKLIATAGAGQWFRVDELVLGLLFDGPEFRDVQEKAEITAHLLGGSKTIIGILKNTYEAPPASNADNLLNWDKARWTVDGVLSGTPENLSPSTESRGAVWRLAKPFGDAQITKLVFTAIDGKAATSGDCATKFTCNNQSDYTFISMKASVPEPATLGLLGLGLLGAAAARRRRAA